VRRERKAEYFIPKCLSAQEVKSPLTLLVAGVRTDDPNHALAADDFALAADLLY
jgi:hypothetical protein